MMKKENISSMEIDGRREDEAVQDFVVEDKEEEQDLVGTTKSTTSSRGSGKSVSISAKFMMVMVGMIVFVMIGVTYNGHANDENNPPATTNDVTSTTATTRSYSSSSNKRKMSGLERLLASEEELVANEDALVAKIVEKLKPSPILFVGDDEEEEEEAAAEAAAKAEEEGEIESIRTKKKEKKMIPHQFLHLHHMKTGGTSIDELLRCSMNRLKKQESHEVPYYSIHECSRSRFTKCLTDKKNSCRSGMDKAAVMSYCGALKHLDEFGWWEKEQEENVDNENVDNSNIKAFTVLRNPVDRVWSMFRFQTKNCFKCKPLKEIYEAIDSGTVQELEIDQLCSDQLQNHEVANLLSSTDWPMEVTQVNDDDETHQQTRNEMIQEAVDNMKGFFTVIGITEELVETALTLGKVIPWMNVTIPANDGTSKNSICSLPHANASPKNNRCGEGSTHWDLPDTPDQETYDLIVKHNSMDIELYEAAVSYFELQRRALNLI